MKKGFTLIELLAVIVILAIIALIATPIILNIIGDTKDSSIVRSGELYLDAVEQAIARKNLNEKFDPLECIVQGDGNLICDGEELIVETTGNRPIYGTISLQGGKIVKITNLELDNYILKKDINGKLIVDRLVDELRPQGTYLMKTGDHGATSSFLNGNITREEIESIVIKNKNSVPNDAIKSWDVSEAQDGSVVTWYTDTNNNGLYEVYIGGDGGVKANKNSSWLFANLLNAISLDLRYLDTVEVTAMERMFSKCNNLTSLDLNNFNTSKVSNFLGMFYECNNLKSLNIISFDTKNATNIGGMFGNCHSLVSLDLSNFNTSRVTNMQNMFESCTGLTEIIGLNNFDTSKAIYMYGMFGNCNKLEKIDVSSFDTSKVTDMSWIFYGCYRLTSLNLSNFDTSQVSNMSYMFNNCINLTEIIGLNNFDTSKTNNTSYMFNNCSKLATIDLRNADFTNVTSYGNMFNKTPKLETIYANSLSKTFIADRLLEVNKSDLIIQEV